ncbi:hypothetical protein TNCT_234151 [Trichonephila clavata]|uniref:Uncharacterized protein n=1 Tax=Trichonephila clavata TaxID=2740835 RepID=A0A8X6HQ27_TRICU|nr:hypothetical protein TNCT_234151 [Trichonephila clavata]
MTYREEIVELFVTLFIVESGAQSHFVDYNTRPHSLEINSEDRVETRFPEKNPIKHTSNVLNQTIQPASYLSEQSQD